MANVRIDDELAEAIGRQEGESWSQAIRRLVEERAARRDVPEVDLADAALDRFDRVHRLLDAVRDDLARDDGMAACQHLALANEVVPDIAADAAQAAYDGGATKKAIADALGVPVYTLTGMARTAKED